MAMPPCMYRNTRSVSSAPYAMAKPDSPNMSMCTPKNGYTNFFGNTLSVSCAMRSAPCVAAWRPPSGGHDRILRDPRMARGSDGAARPRRPAAGGNVRPAPRAAGPAALPAQVEQRFEAAENHALAVERHRIVGRIHARILHHLPDARVAGGLVGPFHPCEHDRLVGGGPHRAAEVGDLALGHVVAPGLDHTRGAGLDEERVEAAGVIEEGLSVAGGNRDHESVDVGHVCLLLREEGGGRSRCRTTHGYDDRRGRSSTDTGVPSV